MLIRFRRFVEARASGGGALSVRPLYHRAELALWMLRGRRGPIPHAVKVQVVLDCARRHKLDALVESGTYFGDMVWAVRNHFQEIHSVELEPVLHGRARNRFRRFRHIHLYLGDSGEVLETIVAELRGPALFWLDGHFSGGVTAQGEVATPIVKELEEIYGDPRFFHVVLIDDAELFVGRDDYPSISQLKAQLDRQGIAASVKVADNIIRIEPQT